VKSDEIWKNIHEERGKLVDTLAALSPEQWSTDSWCEGWSVQQTVGHVVAGAEQTPANFYKELISAGFRFNVFTDKAAKRLGSLGPDELIGRLRARTTTTNHPPAPVMAMLGEIIVHGEDIRRPLVIEHKYPNAALVALADSWKKTNLIIGAKRRIAGLRLRATDNEWTYGDGPEVSGPLVSLILGMTGRKGVYRDLEGAGVDTFRTRS
jgi:uncharacterized protein (TIGR03083 family)